ncbi:unnamed protein product [Chrysoparadoxa australica]
MVKLNRCRRMIMDKYGFNSKLNYALKHNMLRDPVHKHRVASNLLYTVLHDNLENSKTERCILDQVVKCQMYWKKFQIITKSRKILLWRYWKEAEKLIDAKREKMYIRELEVMKAYSHGKLDRVLEDVKQYSAIAPQREGPGHNKLKQPRSIRNRGPPRSETAEAKVLAKRGLKHKTIPGAMRWEYLGEVLHAVRAQFKDHFWEQLSVLKDEKRKEAYFTTSDIKGMVTKTKEGDAETEDMSQKMAQLYITDKSLLPSNVKDNHAILMLLLSRVRGPLFPALVILAERQAACMSADLQRTKLLPYTVVLEIFKIHCDPRRAELAERDCEEAFEGIPKESGKPVLCTQASHGSLQSSSSATESTFITSKDTQHLGGEGSYTSHEAPPPKDEEQGFMVLQPERVEAVKDVVPYELGIEKARAALLKKYTQ